METETERCVDEMMVMTKHLVTGGEKRTRAVATGEVHTVCCIVSTILSFVCALRYILWKETVDVALRSLQ